MKDLDFYRDCSCSSLGEQLIDGKYFDTVANLRPRSVTKVLTNNSGSFVYHMQISPLKRKTVQT
jgi:hypothetical protein